MVKNCTIFKFNWYLFTMRKKNKELINSFWWLSLLIGFFIYLLFRPNNLIYNNFFSFPIKLSFETNNTITNFIIYSLPNGLWSFSYSQFIFHIYKDFTTKTVILSSLMVFFGVFLEVLQYHGFVSGYFDLVDIFAYLISCILILIIQK